MAAVEVRSYLSPTLVLLAFNWQDSADREDFLGFAIQRRPGFDGAESSWLPNRLDFSGPAQPGKDFPSNQAPIQKFMWWDARINTADRGKTFRYTVTPVVGNSTRPQLLTADLTTIAIQLPQEVEQGIGTYFNRAVVSSQAFIREFGANPTGAKLVAALAWLANGMEKVVPEFIKESDSIDAAIYHLSDRYWILPALEEYNNPGSIVYHSTKNDDSNEQVVSQLGMHRNLSFALRTHTSIMHNKFVVQVNSGKPVAVLAGSANFTTNGLTSQANVIHTWDSAELAELYQSRQEFLATDPMPKRTKQAAAWSEQIAVGDAKVRVFFAPEPDGERLALGEVVSAVRNARKSVVFCLFSTTDQELREACFGAGDDGKMMFGLVNNINEPKTKKDNASSRAAVELYHRSKSNHDVYGHALFRKGNQPAGFWWEIGSIRKAIDDTAADEAPEADDASEKGAKKQPPEVYVHHKFVVIDAETDSPIIYTGSANMSGNSSWHNDENLLEIRSCPRLAQAYLAEFLRLYEHYRARAQFNPSGPGSTLKLTPNSDWSTKYYKHGSPESKSRINMASPP